MQNKSLLKRLFPSMKKKSRFDTIADKILDYQQRIDELYAELEELREIGFKYKNKNKTAVGSKYKRDEDKYY